MAERHLCAIFRGVFAAIVDVDVDVVGASEQVIALVVCE